MIHLAWRGRSLYMTLGTIIVLTVVLIMAFQAAYAYFSIKEKMIQGMQQRSQVSMASLQTNVATMIESYAINEYEKLIVTEMTQWEHFAVIVEDFKLGKILGERAFISGKIRNASGELVEYDSTNPDHQEALDGCYYTDTGSIIDPQGTRVGTVSIYIAGEALNQELNNIIIGTIAGTSLISLLLIITLFLTIRYFVLLPLSEMVVGISRCDRDGIPLTPVPVHGPKEIAVLAHTVNTMIETIKRSRKALQVQHLALQKEKERFQLAVDGTLDGLWDWDLQTGQVVHSARFEKMLGYDAGELPNTINAWESLLHPEDLTQASQKVTDYFNAKGVGSYENTFRMRTKEGEWRWIRGRGKALFSQNGRPLRFVGFNTDITEQIQQEATLRDQKNVLQYQANHDNLTGLANRVLFQNRLTSGIEIAKQQGSKLALLFIDLDHFKEINDSLGHESGDKVLQMVTERLKTVKRHDDHLSRLGGDEFTIIMEGLKESSDASILALKVLDALKVPITIDGQKLYVGSSIGISLYPDNGDTAQNLLKYADAAMYKAKSEGRDNYQYYSVEMTEQAFERLLMQTELRRALKQQEFIVYYQPQVNGRTGDLIGMEALARWQHPTQGVMGPGHFLALAERTGLIIELDRLVMQQAMEQVALWYDQGLHPGILAMNLAAKQLHQKDFLPTLDRLIASTGCAPHWLELEVTERQIIEKAEETAYTLDAISERGIKLALDDFGTGYSSLSHLKKMPISKLKIDRSFVMDLPDDEEDASITKAVVALAQNLALEVIAEGVENEAQKDFLVEHGCENIQGYYFAQPMDAKAMEIWLKTHHG